MKNSTKYPIVIVSQPDEGIPIHEMNDGEIGVITKWPIDSDIGHVVQRFDNSLVPLGAPSSEGWPHRDELFDPSPEKVGLYRVRILKSGTVFKIA